MDDTDSLLLRGARGCFPFPAYIGQKSCSGRAVFSQHLISAISVIADRRGAYQNVRGTIHSTERVSDKGGPLDAAFADSLLSLNCPASGSDALTGEVDDRVHPAKRCDLHRPGFRIPVRWPPQAKGVVSFLSKQWDKDRSNQAGGTRQCDSHNQSI